MQRLQIFFTLYNLLLRSPLWNKLRMRTRFPSLIIVVIDLALDDQKQRKPSQTKKSDNYDNIVSYNHCLRPK
jgi:hypothetical protein